MTGGTTIAPAEFRAGQSIVALLETNMREQWHGLIDNLLESLVHRPQVVMTVDEIVAATCCRDPAIRDRWFWRAAQLGSIDFEGFADAGLHLEFFPDRRGHAVEWVTFVRQCRFPHRRNGRL